jgi:hypothetical protein
MIKNDVMGSFGYYLQLTNLKFSAADNTLAESTKNKQLLMT